MPLDHAWLSPPWLINMWLYPWNGGHNKRKFSCMCVIGTWDLSGFLYNNIFCGFFRTLSHTASHSHHKKKYNDHNPVKEPCNSNWAIGNEALSLTTEPFKSNSWIIIMPLNCEATNLWILCEISCACLRLRGLLHANLHATIKTWLHNA